MKFGRADPLCAGPIPHLLCLPWKNCVMQSQILPSENAYISASSLKALRVSESRYRRLFETARDGILILDADTAQIDDVNPYLVELLGYSHEEFLGKKLWEVGTFADTAESKEMFEQLQAQGYVRYDDIPLKTKGGVRIPVEFVSNTYDCGGIKVIQCNIRNITARKQAEAELISAKTAADNASVTKSRFLAAASHDLRQPIQAISLFNEALARTSLNGEQKRINDYLSQSIHTLGDLLNTLLDISKIDAGAARPCPEVIQTEAMMDKINAEFSSLAAGKGLRFKLCFPFREIAVMTDRRMLMRLLGNLIGNAIKYTAQGGVLVAIRRRGHQALIQVWDTGIGITPEHLDSIYDEYFQIGNPERDSTTGLGLGLAIVKRLAKLLETEVVCRSRPGKGSVFEFRLALADQTPKEEPRRIASAVINHAAAPRLARRRIVVVEDDVMVAKAIQVSLESIGMSVTTYGNAENALANSAIADADFYIADFQLPGMNGVEFFDLIQQRSTKHIQAVLLTGVTSSDQIDTTKSSPWTVLFKPVDLPTLLSAIEAQDPIH
jgi:PAS domain S-box-containing protein